MFKSYTQPVDIKWKKPEKRVLSTTSQKSCSDFLTLIPMKFFKKFLNPFIKSRIMDYPHIHTTNSINTVFI